MNEDADVQKILADVVLYKIDAEKDEHGPEYRKLHAVTGYPTFIVMNASGDPINRWMGYEKSFFAGLMRETMADLATIDEKKARFAANPGEPDAALLARYAESRGEYREAADLYRRGGELAGPAGPDHAMDVFTTMMRGATSKQPVFTMAEVKPAAEAALASRHTTPEELIDLALRMAAVADREKDPELKARYLETAETRTRDATDPGVAAARAELMPLHALYVAKDAEKAVGYQKATLPEGWMESATELNGFAWWCFENSVNLAEARTLAGKAVELSAPGKERAMVLDTLAEICNAQGDCREAVELTRQATQEDPGNGYYRQQLARFEEILAKQG